jgi:site-specific recombinase XerD
VILPFSEESPIFCFHHSALSGCLLLSKFKPNKGKDIMHDCFRPRPEELRPLQIGPLAPYLASFGASLSQQGYGHTNGWDKLRLASDLSRWMDRRHLAPRQLDEEQLGVFLKTRWKRTPARTGDRATMTLVLRYLRQSNITPLASRPEPRSDIELIERAYEDFLLNERNLVPASVEQYLPVTRRFLSHRFGSGKVWLKKLRASDVTDFVLRDSSNRGRRSAQLMATVLRSFLGFLLQQGRITANLAAAVPMVAGWRLSELPRFLETKQVEIVVRSCDRRTRVGKRDYAILLLLARLGLRAGEVARLTLEDIDWRASQLLIRGKGSRVDRLPLSQDAGQALADYLQRGRPECSSRSIFIQRHAPHQPLAGPSSISNVVRAALARAQIQSPHQGAHVLRHSLATTMLRNGASIAQIGQVLRHQLPQTTEIYAKVDLNALQALALPWPGGAA